MTHDLSAYDYAFPEALIAQTPLPERDASRLLVLGRHSGTITHRQIREFPALLQAGDLLVVNTSKVMPFHLRGYRPGGGVADLLLLHPLTNAPDERRWMVLATRLKRFRSGMRLTFDATLRGVVESRDGDRLVVRFDQPYATLIHTLERVGTTPLPPYITHTPTPEDRERYQTVYATTPGSAAAPTAGLHLSEALLAACRARGIRIASVILHVGIDTFQPIRASDIRQHVMHGEFFHIPAETLTQIEATKSAGHRVVAVGTTVVRALESSAALRQTSGETRLFITPGDDFQMIDALLTNFHQPRTTLMLLISAFAGRTPLLGAYHEAVRAQYRLFSYGDAMFVV
ncbi:MAG: tRNA preQ1(34) S-adenosylmethionine ribosyltransferase-isomerase QueA [Deltaproteobacteria bacterium]|nr:tRNA preQ1(34) S-adenosylmethionine ribosyltransferase-isomerase QueA [Deltaproteobacteria bacterium]